MSSRVDTGNRQTDYNQILAENKSRAFYGKIVSYGFLCFAATQRNPEMMSIGLLCCYFSFIEYPRFIQNCESIALNLNQFHERSSQINDELYTGTPLIRLLYSTQDRSLEERYDRIAQAAMNIMNPQEGRRP